MNLSSLAAQALNKFTAEPKPAYKIQVEGVDITTTLQGRLIQLTVTDKRGMEADEVEIELDDHDGKLQLPEKGAKMRVYIGWEAGGLTDKGAYTIDTVEHTGAPDKLVLRGSSTASGSGLKTQRERSWHKVTVKDIVCTIADECDLSPAVSDVLAGEKIEHLDQTNETGANLLTRLAKMFDAVATVKDDHLLFFPAGGGVSVSGKPLGTLAITRADGDQHRFMNADGEAYTAVRATYNDVNLGVKGEVDWGAQEDATERKAPAPTRATASGQYKSLSITKKSRAAALREAKKQWKALKKNRAAKGAYTGVTVNYHDRNLAVTGTVRYGQAEESAAQARARRRADKDREANAPRAAIDHSADNLKTLRHVYASKENAKRAARAEWRRLQRGVATFSLTLARGRADILPDQIATLSGWKPQIDSSEWVVTQVVHVISDGGFTSAPEFEIRATELPG